MEEDKGKGDGEEKGTRQEIWETKGKRHGPGKEWAEEREDVRGQGKDGERKGRRREGSKRMERKKEETWEQGRGKGGIRGGSYREQLKGGQRQDI